MGRKAALTLLGLLIATAGFVYALDDEDDAPPPSNTDAPPGPPHLQSARALAQGFEQVTGDQLELERETFFITASYQAGSLDEGAQADAYYGNFLLFVYPTADEAREAVRRRGRWSSYGSGFYGSKALGNVVVQSTFERRRADAAWGRLLRALRAAQNPAAPALPVRERLCERQGIELESGATGTCKRGPQQFVIRAREKGLRLPGIEIGGVRVRRGPSFAAGPLVDDAKGVFVELSFGVRNAGGATIETRPPYELVVGGRRFEEHTAVYGLRDHYPLRPGESDSDVTLFDIPRELAGGGLEGVALEVPGDPARSFAVSDGHVVGHLRLAGPVGRLDVPAEPAPAPLPEPPPLPEPDPELDPGLEPA